MKDNQKGQVALEAVIAFIPWFILLITFIGVVFSLGVNMGIQAAANRAALQVGNYGCLPLGVANEIKESIESPLISDVHIRVVDAGGHGQGTFDHNRFFNDKNRLNTNGNYRQVSCSENGVIRSLDFAIVNLTYKQNLFHFPWEDNEVGFEKNVVVLSQSLQGGGG